MEELSCKFKGIEYTYPQFTLIYPIFKPMIYNIL